LRHRHHHAPNLINALRAGANDYILKNTDHKLLIEKGEFINKQGEIIQHQKKQIEELEKRNSNELAI
jgi:DNA-binding NarL/FixJ family response regulator